jgi:hypothetical protein
MRRRPTKRARAVGKRASVFLTRLAALRKFTSEFDSSRFEKSFTAKPKSAKGKAAKKRDLEKVRRTFARLRPFIHRPHKVVSPRSSRNRDSLREYVGMARLKGLRAIPVPTDRKDKLRVSFDRKGRVKLRDGVAKHKVFLFPHKPRMIRRGRKVVGTLVDDILAMTQEMLKTMPRGQYVLHTAHHYLMPTMEDRDELPGMIRRFANQYKDPEFLKMLRGFKWISGSYEKAQQIQEFMKTERGKLKWERKRTKAENAARVIAAMDRQIKSGKLPKLSKRARMTGRR